MRAPSSRGRICGYKHVRRARQDGQRMLLACGPTTCAAYSENFGWPFSTDVPITDRPRQPLGTHEGLVSRFARAECLASQAGLWPPRLALRRCRHASRGHISAHFGPKVRSQSDNSGRQPVSLATHRAGRAYYIYVASQNAEQGSLTGNPKGSFGRPISFCKRSGQAKTGTGNREVGAIAPLRLTA